MTLKEFAEKYDVDYTTVWLAMVEKKLNQKYTRKAEYDEGIIRNAVKHLLGKRLSTAERRVAELGSTINRIMDIEGGRA